MTYPVRRRELRLLVCGGRGYGCVSNYPFPANRWAFERAEKERRALYEALDLLGPSVVIAGGARGADALARQWAQQDKHILYVQYIEEKADWAEHGSLAGPKRNQAMLDKHKPNMVLAFVGGRGTQDMIDRAKRAGVPVLLSGEWIS